MTAAADAKTAAQALVTNALEAVDAQGTGIAFATEDGFLDFVAVAGPLGELMLGTHPAHPDRSRRADVRRVPARAHGVAPDSRRVDVASTRRARSSSSTARGPRSSRRSKRR